MNDARIALLLPTYNGEKFLAEQLDSLVSQSYGNFIVVIRDDGSTDGTRKVIQRCRDDYPGLIYIVENDGRNLGASGSFSMLMQYVLDHKQELGLAQAYMMFCDQDDVWFQNKIELEMNAMAEAETVGTTFPVLVHSDLRVVSETREQIADSFVRYQGLFIDRTSFGQLLLSNLVTGCTALINEELALKSLPVSTSAVMHDWWLALIAAAFGKLVFLHQPLVEYRQHDFNSIGAKEYIRPTSTGKRFLEKVELHMKSNPFLDEVALQARAFLLQYGDQLGLRQKINLKMSSAMEGRSGVSQKIFYRLVRRF
ncbi:MAG: glycosyltransferase family 2 protein [Gammaproteobacteria bacterium]|nr:glycosyltransferase family 2 protein [Gammaproteobacteria bacterium]